MIGSAGTIVLPGERFCHPREGVMRYRDGRLWLHDYEAGNGVFLRIKAPVELGVGDEFVVGDQLLRIERMTTPQDGPDPGPTYFYSSPKWLSSFRVVQIFEGGALGACVLARGTTLQIGSSQGDFVFPSDPLVSDQHCLIEETAGAILLTDLGSRTGVFVRIKGEQELVDTRRAPRGPHAPERGARSLEVRCFSPIPSRSRRRGSSPYVSTAPRPADGLARFRRKSAHF